MITNTTNENVIKSRTNMPSSGYRMDDANKGFFMKLMRDNVYENIIDAVVREYTTNALDEHVTNKITKPVNITCPKGADPTLKIRDYGAGLTPQGMEDVYISYGASNKRNTNDATGFMGIGCKCAAGYSRIYTITSIVYNKEKQTNWKYTYSATLNEEDEGELNCLGSAPTKEDTGIEVSVPVKSTDIYNFCQAIRKIYHSSIVEGKYRKKPNILNIDSQSEDFWKFDRKPIEQCDDVGYELYCKNSQITPKVQVQMGNIYYPLNSTTLKDNYHLVNDLKAHLVNAVINQHGLVIKMPIGSVLPAASRESLKYDENTIKNLLLKLESIAKVMTASYIEELNSYDCAYYQAKRYGELYTNNNSELVNAAYREANILHQELRLISGTNYSGQPYLTYPLNTSTNKFEDLDIVMHEVSYRGGSNKVFKSDKNSIMNLDKTNIIMLTSWKEKKNGKAETKVGVTRKIKQLLTDHTSNQPKKWEEATDVSVYHISSLTLSVKQMMKQVHLDKTKDLPIYNSLDVAQLKSALKSTGTKSTAHVDLYEYTGRAMATQAWKDASSVTLSAADPILYLPMSGYTGVKSTNETDYKINTIDNNNIDKMVGFIQINSLLIEDKLLKKYLDSTKNITVYGSRKKNWKQLQNWESSYNLFDVWKETVKAKAKNCGDDLRKFAAIHDQIHEEVIITHSYDYNSKWTAVEMFRNSSVNNIFMQLNDDVILDCIPLAYKHYFKKDRVKFKDMIITIAEKTMNPKHCKKLQELKDLVYVSDIETKTHHLYNEYKRLIGQLKYIEEWDTFYGSYSIDKKFCLKAIKAIVDRNPSLLCLQDPYHRKLRPHNRGMCQTLQRVYLNPTTCSKQDVYKLSTQLHAKVVKDLTKQFLGNHK